MSSTGVLRMGPAHAPLHHSRSYHCIERSKSSQCVLDLGVGFRVSDSGFYRSYCVVVLLPCILPSKSLSVCDGHCKKLVGCTALQCHTRTSLQDPPAHCHSLLPLSTTAIQDFSCVWPTRTQGLSNPTYTPRYYLAGPCILLWY